jgi:hypothetical protein
MDRAANGDAGGSRHGALEGLPRRPAAGADRILADLGQQGVHRALGSDGRRWSASLAVLRRVRDALASGGRP